MRRYLMKIIKSAVLGLFLVILIVLPDCMPPVPLSTSTSTRVKSHTVEKVENAEPVWNINKVYVLWQGFCPELSAAMGKVCYLGDYSEPQNYGNIICIGSNSGSVLWIGKSGITPGIIATNAGIFMTYSLPGGATWLAKLDPKNGDLLRRNNLGFLNSAVYLSFINNQIQLYTDPDGHFWVFDTEGNLVKKVADGEIFASMPDQTYKNLTGLNAFTTGTNNRLWEYSDFIDLVPLFTQDKIFLRNGVTGGEVKAFDRKTGKLLWSTADIIISNIAYSPEKKLVYGLRQDGDLVGINDISGREYVIVKFSSVPFIVDGSEANTYQIAYDEQEHIIVVSLGDSSQLFAFKEK